MKHFKLWIYGAPNSGKSTFASQFPKPFFICTDGNYEWLNLPEEDHVAVSTWEETKKAFQNKYEKYDTIIVDLVEDTFKQAERFILKSKKIEHPSDLDWGKGWSMVEDEFIATISQLIALEKNIVLISHESIKTVKGRRASIDIFKPSDRIRERIFDSLEGKMKFLLRCYLVDEETEDYIIKKRKLSLIPKPNELGIARGLNESVLPEDIDLDANEFLEIINNPKNQLNSSIASITKKTKKEVKEEVKEEIKEEINEESTKDNVEESDAKPSRRRRQKEKVVEEETESKEEVKEEVKAEASKTVDELDEENEIPYVDKTEDEKPSRKRRRKADSESTETEETKEAPSKKVEVEEVKDEPKEEVKPSRRAAMEALKAKLLARNK